MIQAIETRYAGCRFRSRLEARWAVFFDQSRIKWEYEPQGLNVSYRLTRREGTFSYLPDFWLPDLALWAEVKGSLSEDELLRLLDTAASLSSNDGGGCHDAGGHDMVVFGPVPQVGRGPFGAFGPDRAPWRLHLHKGDLLASSWISDRPCAGHLVAADVGDDILGGVPPGHIAQVLLEGAHAVIPATTRRALIAARSARFEHGEAG